MDGPDVVVGLEQMAGKAVPEGVRRDALWNLCLSHCLSNRLLYVGVMQMVPFSLTGLGNMGQIGSGKEPLPDKFSGTVWVFVFDIVEHEHPIIPGFQIFCMQLLHLFQLHVQFREQHLGQGNRPIFFPLAVVDGQNPKVKVKGINPEP